MAHIKVLPAFRLITGKVYWPRNSLLTRDTSSSTQKRIIASSGTWMLKEKVSFHLGHKAKEKRKETGFKCDCFFFFFSQ